MKQRIITGVIAAAIFLPIIIYGNMPVVLLAYLLATVGVYELLKMRSINLMSIPGMLALFLLWVTMIPEQYGSVLNDLEFTKPELTFIAILLFLTYTVATKTASLLMTLDLSR